MSDETDRPDELTDELAKKYDPERLLKMFARRAGKGEQLDASIRAKYERRFGVDLGHVRIVTGEFAEEFNRQRDAHAVTIGGTGLILMGNSTDKSMGSRAGEALLAHELTHVAQQQRGVMRRGTFEDFHHAHEIEAHEVEHEVEEHGHEGQAAATAAASQQNAAKAAEDAKKDAIEKIKARVLEMMGETARSDYMRNGVSRRP